MIYIFNAILGGVIYDYDLDYIRKDKDSPMADFVNENFKYDF